MHRFFADENGIKKRIVRDSDSPEVSIIDDRKSPAYLGTSIELRDDKINLIKYRTDISDVDIRIIEDAKKIDYSEYENRLQKSKKVRRRRI